ncbi:MAG: PspC domain-containing protein [Nocardiopsaceae bacterium]|nr:PspC domain-containing protein [Nocardiopsaceae bacterium]
MSGKREAMGGAQQRGAAPAPGGSASAAAERTLAKDNESGVITGVCAGLGAYTRIDPVVWRVGFATTALAGGTGLWLYTAAWLMMRDGSGPAMFEQLFNRRIADRAVPALLSLGLAAATALSLVGGVSWGTLVLATPLILGALVAHNRGVNLQQTYRELPGLLQSREPPPTAPEPEPKPAYYNPAQPWAQAPDGPIDLAVVAERSGDAEVADHGDPDGGDPDGAPDEECGSGGSAERAQERARERARERRRAKACRNRGVRLLPLVLWAVVAVTGIAFGVAGGASVAVLVGPQTGPVYLGSVVVIIGVALLVGAWVAEPRGLVTLGTLTTLLLIASVSVDLTAMRFGHIQWRPATAAEAQEAYALTGWRADLDLTAVPLEPGQQVDVSASVRFGNLDVLVPDTARVIVHGKVTVGELRIDDMVRTGARLDMRRTLEPEPVPRGSADGDADQGREGASGDPPTLVVNLMSYTGDVEVRRVSP